MYNVEQINAMKRKEMKMILQDALGDKFEKRFLQLCAWTTQVCALRQMMIETFKIKI